MKKNKREEVKKAREENEKEEKRLRKEKRSMLHEEVGENVETETNCGR